jgi:prolyl-tRNA synthetase
VRWSQALIPTLKETPADAVAPSHVLLLRAGMIRQLGAGTYSYLPLGCRVLHKAEQVVREEMDRAGALELLMPAVHPAELWEESGRYSNMGGILMEFVLGGDKRVVLGPTHEEVVTDIARDLIQSYKQIPITLYQIQTKFRNEPRPRFGILRTREFLMKDAYSFGADKAQLDAAYDAMFEAYCRVFDRCGFPYVIVEAESGPIGGDSSHEFMVPCSVGEDIVIRCPKCGYAANRERAEIGAIPSSAEKPSTATPPQLEPVATPGQRTIEQVSTFLKVKPEETGKLLVFLADGKPVAALLRGDHEANEAKVRRAFGASSLEPADAATVERTTGAPMGFLGPVAIKIPMVVDRAVAAMPSLVAGGNALDVHVKGVVPGRDFPLDRLSDLRNAGPGDACPRCATPMELHHGIEIGHVFKLGTKYSKAMGASFLDEKSQAHPLIMGCYGIGVNRILAAAVETGHDPNGIIWPLSIAPYQVLIVPLQVDKPDVMKLTDELDHALTAAGHDCLVDDRDLRPGVKFKDADLIGIPLRIVIGERGLKEGSIELKWRHEAAPKSIPAANAAQLVLDELRAAIESLDVECTNRRNSRACSRV